MSQLDLFAGRPAPAPSLPVDRPRARRSNSAGSHVAAAAIKASGALAGQQAATLAVVQAHPGSTTAELEALSGIPRHTLGRRLPELVPELITKGADRRCSVGHRLAATWWPA